MFEVEVFKVFLLVMARFSGMMVSAPVLGSRNFPVIAKVGLVALSAVLITPTVPALDAPLPDAPAAFALLAAGDLLIGLMMGFTMTLVFAAIQVAGQLLDMLTGFAMMNVFNPALETQVPIFGFFLYVIAVLYLLVLNGHHMMIKAMAASFEGIPLGGFVLNPALLREVSTWGSVMFYDGLMIAAPVAAALLLAYVTMGLLSRLVPQIHLFVVGFPLTIAMGLILVALSMSVYMNLLDGMFVRMFRDVHTVVRAMS
ncbi:MAG: flagellar biosynthetic protein FliR [Candidatus Hydrogenedentes bacterium]|nr:flagellar biosynthetic protein FliR [Candidatus Hydrogenedentota bacterium]